MTAQEKANELVTEYKYCCGGSDIIQLRTNAKQCALIAVDEILSAIQDLGLENVNWDYWQEVRKEIEQL